MVIQHRDREGGVGWGLGWGGVEYGGGGTWTGGPEWFTADTEHRACSSRLTPHKMAAERGGNP